MGHSFYRLLLVAGLAVSSGCGSGAEQVTYGKDVVSIFEPCTSCHRPGSPVGPGTLSGFDILDPYSSDDGLLVAKNKWKEGDPAIDSPVMLVVPGDPDQSFLMDKIGNTLPGDQAGSPMPQQFGTDPFELTDTEKNSIETWIREGATETDQFNQEVVPIIGNDGRFEGPGGDFEPTTGDCQYCHFAGTSNPLDLSDPFGSHGLVNVRATYRTDKLRVRPFDSENSFLVSKIRAALPGSEQGAPMPRSFSTLSEGQIATVRQWILDGALP